MNRPDRASLAVLIIALGVVSAARMTLFLALNWSSYMTEVTD